MRLLDEHCRVYQYLLKRTVGPFVAAACQPPIANEAIQRRSAYLNGRRDDLYDLSLYLVLLYEAPHVARRSTELRRVWQAPRQALRAWLSPDHALQLVEAELDRAIGTRHHKAQALEVQIGEFGPTRLEKQDAFRFFRELVNYAPAVVDAARLTHDTYLDYFVSDSAIDCHRDHLLVGDRFVKVLSMKGAAEPDVRVPAAGRQRHWRGEISEERRAKRPPDIRASLPGRRTGGNV
jgi:type IV secretion system protein VirB4